jgi:hypothetical protein
MAYNVTMVMDEANRVLPGERVRVRGGWSRIAIQGLAGERERFLELYCSIVIARLLSS